MSIAERPVRPVTDPSPDERARRKRGALVLPAILVLSDALCVSAGLYLSWYTRYVLEFGPEIEEFNFQPYSTYFPLQLWLVGITIATFQLADLYRTQRGLEWFDDIPSIVRGTAVGVMIVFTGVALSRYPASSRLTFILAWMYSSILVVLGRALVQWLLAFLYRRGIGIDRVLVVGGNNFGRMIMQSLAARGHLGYEVAGFVDDDRLGDFGPFHHLGGIADVERVALAERIDQVIVALPAASHGAILGIVDLCQRAKVRFKIVPDLYELSLSRVDVDTVSGIPLIGLKAMAIQGGNAMTKRAVDIVFAVGALLVCAPVMLVVAALIWLESGGPVLYRQIRIGKDQQPFGMYKFRSMRQDAERLRRNLVLKKRQDGRLFKDPNDPRRTRVGAVLRRWSLDELPQFWNVLIGDMSVVGPRPQIPEEVAGYEEWHRKRLAVSPGVTGLWQVSGRSELSFDEMVHYDIYYIQNWSLGLDIRILLRTIPTVLRARGAF